MPFFNPIGVLSILIAITVHECSHALAAKKLGDDTAEYAGRLTLNPLAHIDPIGAILFLIVGFGWAKPVPVNPLHFRNPRRDNALVALAGPASNLVLAFLVYLGLHLLLSVSPQTAESLLGGDGGNGVGMQFLAQFLRTSLFVNLGLMAFNLLPIAPLDGSKILEPFVPLSVEEGYAQFMRNGPFILLGLLILESFLPVRILSTWVFSIMDWVLMLFGAVLGG